MNAELSKYKSSTFDKLFIDNHPTEKTRVVSAIKRCRNYRENGRGYPCHEHWCKECDAERWNIVVQDSLSFVNKELDTPVFATVLLKFIKSPTPKVWKRITNKAIKEIEMTGITGIWFPEIAFKADKPKQIDKKEFGFSSERRHFVHLHGIMSLKDKARLKAMFPIPEQTHVIQIGIGSYACMSMEQNIINVVRYSTKKKWKTGDVAVIEANANGFGCRLT
ncbi:MAG: hypothetical protein QGF20_17755 [Alphaproteobacteria bacterium]|nr:hypothetical protein [Alphaproteobacteria bacterium]